MKGVGQNYIVAQTPLFHNVPLFVKMIAKEGVEVILTLDEATQMDVPHWYPKGAIGTRLRYEGYCT